MTRRRYAVRAWHSWQDVGAGRRAIDADYTDRADAIAAGRRAAAPLVDVIDRRDGLVIAERCALMHPQHSEPALWRPRRYHVIP